MESFEMDEKILDKELELVKIPLEAKNNNHSLELYQLTNKNIINLELHIDNFVNNYNSNLIKREKIQ